MKTSKKIFDLRKYVIKMWDEKFINENFELHE